MSYKNVYIGAVFALGISGLSCSANDNGDADRCLNDNAPAECAMDCSNGDACPVGFYCGDAMSCSSDCTIGSADCGEGYYCSVNGQCAETIDTPPIDCPDVTLNLAAVTPTVVLLVDQSGSMNTALEQGGPSRWDAVKTVLLDPTTGVVANLDGRVNFGASLYSSVGGGSVPDECPIINQSLPSTNNYTDLVTLFDNNTPSADTPTAESVDAIVQNFASFSGPRVIVLATDGAPDRCDDSDAHDQQSRDLSETAVQNAFDGEISTFVLSVGDQVAESHLQRLANAGQGLALDLEPVDGAAEFYVATDAALLAQAFESIITGVRTCEATLDQAVDPNRVGEGVVTLNGVEITFGTDWQLNDETTIELLGEACDTMLSAESVELVASFPCGIVID